MILMIIYTWSRVNLKTEISKIEFGSWDLHQIHSLTFIRKETQIPFSFPQHLRFISY